MYVSLNEIIYVRIFFQLQNSPFNLEKDMRSRE